MECPFGADGELDRFGLRAGDALDEAQEGLRIGHIGEALLAVLRCQFEPATVCHQLTTFLGKPLFQLVPVFSGRLKIRLLGKDFHDVHDGEEPRLGFLIVNAADFVSLKNGEVFFHSNGVNFNR